jgi:tagaturonate epimerase
VSLSDIRKAGSGEDRPDKETGDTAMHDSPSGLTRLILEHHAVEDSRPVRAGTPDLGEIRIYPRSVHEIDDGFLFLFRASEGPRRLGMVCSDPTSRGVARFDTEGGDRLEDGSRFRWGRLSPSNAETMRELFPFTAPRVLGPKRSFGFGDRLGLAGPAHIEAVRETSFRPVLAQQSIRELERTGRSAGEVLDAATFAVFQEGYREGFGADGDHLKTTADIDRMVARGYTLYTFDPGDHVLNEADRWSPEDRAVHARNLPWDRIGETPDGLVARYAGRSFQIEERFALVPDLIEVTKAVVKYGRVIAHVADMFRHLAERTGNPFEVEISVDETEAVTTPFEHFLVASELIRLGVRIDAIAPRFVGRFEKGVDFRGDLADFHRQFEQHVAVARRLGPYKLSLHSGSDKFSIYPGAARAAGDYLHVKTAGTSYLEALRAAALVDAAFFREILECSLREYPTAKASYHVSANPDAIPDPSTLTDEDGPALVAGDDDVRQVLHVAFGAVLTAEGGSRFRDRLLDLLDRREDLHHRCLLEHFSRHLAALGG